MSLENKIEALQRAAARPGSREPESAGSWSTRVWGSWSTNSGFLKHRIRGILKAQNPRPLGVRATLNGTNVWCWAERTAGGANGRAASRRVRRILPYLVGRVRWRRGLVGQPRHLAGGDRRARLGKRRTPVLHRQRRERLPRRRRQPCHRGAAAGSASPRRPL